MYGINAAMGYILHAVFVGGADYSELSEVHDEFIKNISENELEKVSFSNFDTQMLLIDVLKKYEMEESRIELIGQIMNWLFDSNTVGEAETYYRSYKYIMRSEINY